MATEPRDTRFDPITIPTPSEIDERQKPAVASWLVKIALGMEQGERVFRAVPPGLIPAVKAALLAKGWACGDSYDTVGVVIAGPAS